MTCYDVNPFDTRIEMIGKSWSWIGWQRKSSPRRVKCTISCPKGSPVRGGQEEETGARIDALRSSRGRHQKEAGTISHAGSGVFHSAE